MDTSFENNALPLGNHKRQKPLGSVEQPTIAAQSFYKAGQFSKPAKKSGPPKDGREPGPCRAKTKIAYNRL